MRKIMVLVLVLVTLVMLARCAQNTNLVQTTQNNEEATTLESTSARTIVFKTNPETGLIEYVPGNVVLNSDNDYSDFGGYRLSFRRVYYLIDGLYIDYIGQEKVNMYFESKDKDRDWEKEPQEMALVSLIKHFNIPKKDFIELTKLLEERNVSQAESGWNMNGEDYELPNADIIYTFDNDIINEYYRRE